MQRGAKRGEEPDQSQMHAGGLGVGPQEGEQEELSKFGKVFLSGLEGGGGSKGGVVWVRSSGSPCRPHCCNEMSLVMEGMSAQESLLSAHAMFEWWTSKAGSTLPNGTLLSKWTLLLC